MPGWVPSAQGTTITFDGIEIGLLRGFDSSHQVGQMTDVTNVYSDILGTGADTRVVRQYDCTSVEPANISCSFYGAAPFVHADLGVVALLVFDSPQESYSAYAMLTEFTNSGSAGEFATGTASFQLTDLISGGSS